MTTEQMSHWHTYEEKHDSYSAAAPYYATCVKCLNCCFDRFYEEKTICKPTFFIEADIESASVIIINNEQMLKLKAKEYKKPGSHFSGGQNGVTYRDEFYFDIDFYEGKSETGIKLGNKALHPKLEMSYNSDNTIKINFVTYHSYRFNNLTKEYFNPLKVCETCPYKDDNVCENCPMRKQLPEPRDLGFSGKVLIRTSFINVKPSRRRADEIGKGRNSYYEYEFERFYLANNFWVVKKEPVNEEFKSAAILENTLCGKYN